MKPERITTPFVRFFMLGLLLLSGCAAVGDGPSGGTLPALEQPGEHVTGPSIKEVMLAKVGGRERVSILLSEAADFDVSRESDTVLSVTLKGVFLPAGMKREHTGEGLNIIEKVSLSRWVAEGNPSAGARIFLERMTPYRYRKDGPRVIVDFDVSALSYGRQSDRGPVTAMDRKDKAARAGGEPRSEREGEYTGEEISLDFQDADIKSVFRLISEVSGFNIIAGPNVKAEVTVHMEKVPWDQALDALLEINGLGQKQSGRVITVLPLEELKRAEEEQKEKDVAEGRLRQISIEAKIVEVSTTFAQELGVRWGAGLKAGDFAMGIGSASSGTVTAIPGGSGIGLTGSNVAVNFPSATTVAAPAIGLLYGTSRMILNAKLAALETTGDGKIISSPKVTTLDSVTATIKQGEEIPYTVTDSDGNTSTEFKEATLKLEVTPIITPEGKISIKVNASNDYADWETDPATGLRVETPPINTSSVESTVVVRDGDTIVIGGVYKMTETDSVSGVPFLSRIPILGWLFKYKTVSNEKRELLIFVTPTIVSEAG
ncbi:MAG: secretin and TonB N-terminal domain-containing protein [Deltaproteobacteria bacterium]|nr:secretin and TonB N-terminal domain-containing protein [Deltaproteobacteria bacterium]